MDWPAYRKYMMLSYRSTLHDKRDRDTAYTLIYLSKAFKPLGSTTFFMGCTHPNFQSVSEDASMSKKQFRNVLTIPNWNDEIWEAIQATFDSHMKPCTESASGYTRIEFGSGIFPDEYMFLRKDLHDNVIVPVSILLQTHFYNDRRTDIQDALEFVKDDAQDGTTGDMCVELHRYHGACKNAVTQWHSDKDAFLRSRSHNSTILSVLLYLKNPKSHNLLLKMDHDIYRVDTPTKSIIVFDDSLIHKADNDANEMMLLEPDECRELIVVHIALAR